MINLDKNLKDIMSSNKTSKRRNANQVILTTR